MEEEEGCGITTILTIPVLCFFASLIPSFIPSCSIQSPVPTVSTDQLQNCFKVYCTVDILQTGYCKNAVYLASPTQSQGFSYNKIFQRRIQELSSIDWEV